MRSRGPLRPLLLFSVAAVLSISSTIQAWRLQMLSEPESRSLHLAFQLLVLNGVYWFVPALIAPLVVAITRRYRIGHTRWATAVGVHVLCAVAYSLVHTSVLLVTRAMLFPYGGRVMATTVSYTHLTLPTILRV